MRTLACITSIFFLATFVAVSDAFHLSLRSKTRPDNCLDVARHELLQLAGHCQQPTIDGLSKALDLLGDIDTSDYCYVNRLDTVDASRTAKI